MVSSTRVPVSYQLVIEVRAPVRCSVGRLGVVDFPSGTYVYTGSARRNLLNPSMDFALRARDASASCLAADLPVPPCRGPRVLAVIFPGRIPRLFACAP